MLVTGVSGENYAIGEGSQLFPGSKLGRISGTFVPERIYSSQLSLFPSNTDQNSNAERIVINVRGHKYETWETTLAIFPDTLLGSPDKRQKYYSTVSHEYVFNSDKDSFDAILFYYQSGGILSRPYNVDRHLFEKELRFFEIEDAFDRRNRFEKELKLELEEQEPLPSGIIKRKIWITLEYPHSSKLAKYLGYWSYLVILISVVGLCAETVPGQKGGPYTLTRNITMGNSWTLTEVTVNRLDHWSIIESVAVAWFSIEYILRLLSAPKLVDFAFSALGAVDFLTVMPFYVGIIFKLSQVGSIGSTLRIIRILRLIRIARIFKLTRYNEGLKVVITALYQSGPHLRSIIVVIVLTAVLFASLIFYAESFSNPATKSFVSIPDSIWYTLITQTSVGYGDIYPESAVGKLVGGVTAVVGVLLFCLPAPVLVNKFIECYYLRQNVSEQDDPQRKAFIESMKDIYFQ